MSHSIAADPNGPVTLARFNSEIEAVAVLAALAEIGIQGITTGSFTAGFITEAPGDISVIVRQSDLPKSLEVLAELQATKNNVDWSSVDVGEPEA